MSITPYQPPYQQASPCDFCKGTRFLKTEGTDAGPCPFCNGTGTNQWRIQATRNYVIGHRLWITFQVLVCFGIWIGWIIGINVTTNGAVSLGGFLLGCVAFGRMLKLVCDWLESGSRTTISSPVAPVVLGGVGLYAAHKYVKHHGSGNPMSRATAQRSMDDLGDFMRSRGR